LRLLVFPSAFFHFYHAQAGHHPAANSEPPQIIINAGQAEKNYWRDISVPYKQTVIGIVWAVIRPFLTMVVFTSIFEKVAKFPSEG
jgi:lipopolysaccharide transport system permease protein